MVGVISTIQINPGSAETPATGSPTPGVAGAAALPPSVPVDQADVVFTRLVNAETGLDEAGLHTLEVVKIPPIIQKKVPRIMRSSSYMLLDQIGVKDGATVLVLTAGDGFSSEVPLGMCAPVQTA